MNIKAGKFGLAGGTLRLYVGNIKVPDEEQEQHSNWYYLLTFCPWGGMYDHSPEYLIVFIRDYERLLEVQNDQNYK